MKLRLLISSLFIFVSFSLAAPELMEAVAAIVDGKPIMRSELLESFYRYQAMPESAGKSEADLKKEVLRIPGLTSIFYHSIACTKEN